MKNRITFPIGDTRIYPPGTRPANQGLRIRKLPVAEVSLAEPLGGYRTVELAPARTLICRTRE